MVYIFLFDVLGIEIIVYKQCRPWSDAAFCGVGSETALFVYVPQIGRSAWKEMV